MSCPEECLNIASVGLNIARDNVLFVDRVLFDLVHQLTNPNSVAKKEINLHCALEN